MKTINPADATARQLHQFILGSIGPRPVAFASTLDEKGTPNLAPFSFFNVFSSSPPVLIFSASSRSKEPAEKDTLRNIRKTGEVVINMVDYSMARQMAIAAVEYDQEVDEFRKSGLTPLKSQIVKPFRVKESPAHFECQLEEIRPLGDKPRTNHLIIARVVLIHIRKEVFTKEEKIDPHKMDLVGRLGAYNYCRASGEAIFSIVQPYSEIAMGFDALPDHIKNSRVLTANDLALLAGATTLPDEKMVKAFAKDKPFLEFWQSLPANPRQRRIRIHSVIRQYLTKGQVQDAWKLILALKL